MTTSNHVPHGRRSIALCATFLAFFATIGCSDPPPLLDEIDHTAWEQTTERTLDFAVPGHGNGLRKIYADPVVFEQSLEADGDIHYPNGSTFVKEVYSTPAPATAAEPAMLVAMVKDPEDPRSRGGWIWLTRDPGSGVETVFEDEFCVTCHTNANEPHPYGTGNPEGAFRDYVFHTPALEAAP